jgi:UDP-N-acetyl-2-amino-2-deoxyglucuronate dehydrogenase
MSGREGRQLGVALVGAGDMGVRHLRAYAEMEKDGTFTPRLTGLIDPDAELVRRRVSWYAEATGRELISYPDAAPSHLHDVLAIQAMEAGRHVMVEKPLALSVARGRKVVEVAQATGLAVGVGHNYRFFPSNRAVRHIIEAGIIGRPYFCVAQYLGPSGGMVARSWAEGTVKADAHDVRVTGSRAAVAMGVHETDLLRYWFGEVDEAYGVIRTFDTDVRTDGGDRLKNNNDDTAMATLTFASGMVAQYTISFAGSGSPARSRSIQGAEGNLLSTDWASWDGGVVTGRAGRRDAGDFVRDYIAELTEAQQRQLLPPGSHQGELTIAFDDPMRYGIAAELEQFAAAAVTGGQPEVNAEEGLKSDAVALAVLESAYAGRPVRVADVESGALADWQRSVAKDA